MRFSGMQFTPYSNKKGICVLDKIYRWCLAKLDPTKRVISCSSGYDVDISSSDGSCVYCDDLSARSTNSAQFRKRNESINTSN